MGELDKQVVHMIKRIILQKRGEGYMRNHYQQNSYSAQQWHQYSAQQQMLQQQGFVKKKGCNCGKKNNKNNQSKGRY